MAKPRAKKPAAPAVGPLQPVLSMSQGAIVDVGGKVCRIAWHWMFRGERDATAVRWQIADPPRWGEPTTLDRGTLGKIVDDPGEPAEASGPADADPLAGERGGGLFG
jgi:hypothetical protein